MYKQDNKDKGKLVGYSPNSQSWNWKKCKLYSNAFQESDFRPWEWKGGKGWYLPNIGHLYTGQSSLISTSVVWLLLRGSTVICTTQFGFALWKYSEIFLLIQTITWLNSTPFTGILIDGYAIAVTVNKKNCFTNIKEIPLNRYQNFLHPTHELPFSQH